MEKPENVRELIAAVEPDSILPDKNSGGREALSSLFSSREKVYFVGDRVPAWWSPERDKWLWHLLLGSDVLASAVFSTSARLSSVPVNISPADQSNRNHRRVAMWSDMLLKYFWSKVAFQVAMDWQSQDNGAFLEIMGAGPPDGPIEPTKIPGTGDYLYAMGLRVLDPQYCTRTNDATYPVLYLHKDDKGVEKYYKFHSSRILNLTQMPSSRRDLRGIGLCGASRCVRQVLRLDDITALEDEIMGSRPISQMVFSRAISAEEMEGAFIRSDEKTAAQQLIGDRRRQARTVFISAQGPPDLVKASSVETFPLSRLPEGYNPEIIMNLAINVISMALGFDPREIWPATVRGATRADAEVQDRKAMRKTPTVWEAQWTQELQNKWCPSVTRATFDEQDDAQDRSRAEIHEIHANTLAVLMEAGIVDEETAWQIMLEEGDITEQQYIALRESEFFSLAVESRRLALEAQRLQNEATERTNAEPIPTNSVGSGSDD